MTEMVTTCPVDGSRSCALHENGIQAESLVTKESCVEKHKMNVWAFSVLFGLMSLFLALSGVALASSNSTNNKVGDVQMEMATQLADSDKAFAVYLARQDEADKALLSTLDAMKSSINANTETLKGTSEQLRIQNTILERMLEKAD